MLIESGRMEHEVDFERHRCGTGSLLHVRPGQVQRFLRDAGAAGWALLFTPEFVPPQGSGHADFTHGPCPAFTLKRDDRAIVTLTLQALEAAASELQDARPESLLVLRHMLAALLLLVARARESALGEGARHPDGAMRLYDRFVRELEGRFASSHTASDYAARIGASSKSLVRACRTVAGIGPKRVIERRIVLEGKRLLAHTTLSITAIATELGFSEPTNFVKFFRRCEGTTPAAFRERYRVG